MRNGKYPIYPHGLVCFLDDKIPKLLINLFVTYAQELKLNLICDL